MHCCMYFLVFHGRDAIGSLFDPVQFFALVGSDLKKTLLASMKEFYPFHDILNL